MLQKLVLQEPLKLKINGETVSILYVQTLNQCDCVSFPFPLCSHSSPFSTTSHSFDYRFWLQIFCCQFLIPVSHVQMTSLKIVSAFINYLSNEKSPCTSLPPNKAHLSRLMTKLTKWLVHPAKTQISLGIHPFWSVWVYWADTQADLSLRWAHSHFVGFVMRRLIFNRDI